MTAPPVPPGRPGGTAAQALRDWRARRVLDADRLDRVEDEIFVADHDRVAYLRRFGVLMALSTLIATFGIANDSGPVVIGAMLVAPLMSPLLGLAAALTLGKPARQLESLLVVAGGAAGAIALAWLAAKTFPEPRFVTEQSGELLARTEPGTLDMSIALAAGAAGAYVTVHAKAVSALPGAAIAVALIPPLSAVGISLELGRGELAGGAMLLFVTNLAGIVLAAALTFIAAGVVARREGGAFATRTRWGLALAAVAVLAVSYPLGRLGQAAVAESLDQREVSTAIENWIGERELTVEGTAIEDERVDVDLVGPRAPGSVGELTADIRARLGRPVEVSVRFTQRRELGDPGVTRPIRRGAGRALG